MGWITAIALTTWLASGASASFTPGTLVVLRLGNGQTAFDANRLAQPIYLDEFNLMNGAAGASHAMPATGAAAVDLTARSDDHDGHLNLSDNGQYLTFGGYRTTPGAAYPVSATSVAVPRVAALVDGNWNVDTATALTDAYSGATINAVMTDDGTRLWTAGNGGAASAPLSGGLRYVSAKGASSSINISQTQTVGGSLAPDAMRNARLVNGQIYLNTASQGSYGNRGVYKTNIAKPMPSDNTPVGVTGVIINHEGSTTDDAGNSDPDGKGKLHPKSDSVFLDLNGDNTFDVAYTTGGKEELEKWSFSTGTWTRSDLLFLPSSEEINALGVFKNGGVTNVYASTDGGIYSFADTGGAGGIVSSTVAAPNPNMENKRFLTSSYLIQAPSTSQFRGFAVIVPEPTFAALSALSIVALRRRRA